MKIAVIGLLGNLLIRLIGGTARARVTIDPEARTLLDSGQPLIFCLFHSQILYPIYYHRNTNIDILVSNSPDGQYISRVVKYLGYGSCVGSARRGGVGGAVAMVNSLRQNRRIGFTVDGPLGPRFVVKSGIIWLAAHAQAPILPISAAAKPAFVFKSWDKFMLPLPFSRISYRVEKPFIVPPIQDDETKIEEYRVRLEQVMHALVTTVES